MSACIRLGYEYLTGHSHCMHRTHHTTHVARRTPHSPHTPNTQLLYDPLTVKRPYEEGSIHYTTQQDTSSCGRASATIVLNALVGTGVPAPVDPTYNYPYWTQDAYTSSECVASNWCVRARARTHVHAVVQSAPQLPPRHSRPAPPLLLPVPARSPARSTRRPAPSTARPVCTLRPGPAARSIQRIPWPSYAFLCARCAQRSTGSPTGATSWPILTGRA